jgi:hypothetical protein
MISRSHIFIPIGVLGLSATMTLSGCSRGTNLNVINRSTAELTNVVATGSGFTQSLGSIPAGKQHSISVNSRSESDLKLDFDVNSKHFTSKPQGYFEGGNVTATVATDFSVTVDTKR